MFRPLALLLLASVAASACTPLRGHQGYIVDADLVNSIQPGVDTRQSVEQVLGRPTLAAGFNQGDWYYIARDIRNLAFNNPRPVQQSTFRVKFNDAGVVTAIDRSGMEQLASISPTSKKTPTLGRERGFFQDLFGNIGTVGAGGGAPGGGPGGP